MLIRGSEKSQLRVLRRTGLGVVAVIAMGIGHVAFDPFGGKPEDVVSISIETPYVGPGVVDGTPLIMHGVKVGEVSTIASVPNVGVQLNADLLMESAEGLTDAMGIDFRPANYFGVTGINLIPSETGRPLRSGANLSVVPKGNFALQVLLDRLGTLSSQVITPRLISVADRATRYTDALTPLLETMITISTTVTNVQTVGTAQLLRNVTGINVAFPGMIDAAITTGDAYLHTKVGVGFDSEKDIRENPYVSYYDEKQSKNYDDARRLLATDPDLFANGRMKEWLEGAQYDLFGPIGYLESSHIYELFPVVEQLRMMTDVIPKIVPAQDISATLAEVRTRLERMYEGSGEQRALQVRVVLDEFPAVAGPLDIALGGAR